jgi:hypothetical protein
MAIKQIRHRIGRIQWMLSKTTFTPFTPIAPGEIEALKTRIEQLEARIRALECAPRTIVAFPYTETATTWVYPTDNPTNQNSLNDVAQSLVDSMRRRGVTR